MLWAAEPRWESLLASATTPTMWSWTISWVRDLKWPTRRISASSGIWCWALATPALTMISTPWMALVSMRKWDANTCSASTGRLAWVLAVLAPLISSRQDGTANSGTFTGDLLPQNSAKRWIFNWTGGKFCSLCGKITEFTPQKGNLYEKKTQKVCTFASVKTKRRCETFYHHLLLIQINYEKNEFPWGWELVFCTFAPKILTIII